MQDSVFSVGSRVSVTSYGPFWGLRGTIRSVYPIGGEFGESWHFYLIELEGMESGEPIWFAQDEVAALDSLSVPVVARD